MTVPYRSLNATELLDIYFIENRARLLDIAAFLDRIDRYEGAGEARGDFRYKAFMQAVALLQEGGERTVALQMLMSDPTDEPITSSAGLKAVGAWDGGEE